MKIRITGYYEPSGDETDAKDTTGLTEEAYLDLIVDEHGMGLKVADLNDLTVEVVRK